MKKCEHWLIIMGRCPVCKKQILHGKVSDGKKHQDLKKLTAKMMEVQK